MAGLTQAEQRDIRSCSFEMADAARCETLQHFRSADLVADSKDAQDFDPVTMADRNAERIMRDVLARRRPQDGILGEEFGSESGESGLTWVLDPIDGTRGYISGAPTWGTLIALRDENGPVFGLIDQPYIGERFVGGFGEARLLGPRGERPLQTCAARPLAGATLFSTFPEVGSRAEEAAFTALSRQVQLTRYGMDCYAYAMLALGQIDLVVEAALNPYDIQAPIAVVQAAGGIVTDWRGNSAHDGGRALAAANPEIHAAALEILSMGEGL